MEYIFKFVDLIIEMKLSDNTRHDSIITKITEMEVEFDEENNKFLVIAFTGNKIIQKKENNIQFFYQRAKIKLGYYNSDLNKIIKLIGSYIDLKKGYQIIQTSEIVNSSCFIERKSKTLSNLVETGFFSYSHNGIIDKAFKEKMYEDIKIRLNGILSNTMLMELIKY